MRMIFGILLFGIAFAVSPQTQDLLTQANNFAAQARKTSPNPSPDQALWKQAIAKAEEATKTEPTAPETWMTLAYFYTETGFWIRADAAWNEYLKRGTPGANESKQIALTQMNLGYAAYGLENYPEAISRFKGAAEFAANDASPQAWLGRIALEQGNVGAARDYYQKAVNLDPSEANRYFLNQVQAMTSFGHDAVRAFLKGYDTYQTDKAQSLAYFSSAAEAAPQWLEASRWVGRLQIELNQPDQALSTWQGVSSLGVATGGDRYFLRYAQLGKEYGLDAAKAFLDGVNAYEINKTSAQVFFQKAVEAAPNFADAWYWLGRTAYEGRNFALAESAYSRVLQIQPDNKEAQYWLIQARKQK